MLVMTASEIFVFFDMTSPWGLLLRLGGFMVEKSITVRAGYGLGAIPGFTWQSLTTFRRRNPFKLRSAKILLGGSNGLQDRRH